MAGVSYCTETIAKIIRKKIDLVSSFQGNVILCLTWQSDFTQITKSLQCLLTCAPADLRCRRAQVPVPQAPGCTLIGLDLWTSLFTGSIVSNYCFFQSWLEACSYESFLVQSTAGGKLTRELVWGVLFLQKSPSWTFSWKETFGSNSSKSRSMSTKAMAHLSSHSRCNGVVCPPAEPVAAGALARSSGSQRHSTAHPAPADTAPRNSARRAGKTSGPRTTRTLPRQMLNRS